MRTNIATVAGLLALATAASATSHTVVNNFCDPDFPVWFTWTPGGGSAEPIVLLASGHAESRPIVGSGDVATISNDSSLAAQLSLGSTAGSPSDNNLLYWSLANNGIDPLAGKHFNVTSNGTFEDICGNSVGYDGGQVHACTDDDVTLTVNLCRFNAQD